MRWPWEKLGNDGLEAQRRSADGFRAQTSAEKLEWMTRDPAGYFAAARESARFYAEVQVAEAMKPRTKP